MRVRVLYFGILRDVAGQHSQELNLDDGASVGDLWKSLREQNSHLDRFDRAVAIAVNHAYSTPDQQLTDGDEVALLPPVSGGAPHADAASESAVVLPMESDHARLQREPIDGAALAREVRAEEDGAVCTFDGVVRNNTRGRRTLYLEYDSYPQLAVAQMERLAVEVLSKFAVRDVRLVHRVGCLKIGETSVLIVVASAHRAAAFEACRWLIDTLKKTVPVWKKEFFEDGAVWADGDPFPPDIPTV